MTSKGSDQTASIPHYWKSHVAAQLCFFMFQSSPGYLDTCQDTILLYSSDISTNSKVWPFIQYLESGRLHYVYTDQIRQTLQLHERDNQQFSLRLDRSFVHIIFKTADETCAIVKQIGNGFRMIAYASGKQYMSFTNLAKRASS